MVRLRNATMPRPMRFDISASPDQRKGLQLRPAVKARRDAQMSYDDSHFNPYFNPPGGAAPVAIATAAIDHAKRHLHDVVRVGERCLLGANAGIGISLGDDCIVEAGLYVTAGTRVTLPDGSVVKGRELSGRNGLLMRRNSQSGAVEALPRSGKWGGLNAALHAND